MQVYRLINISRISNNRVKIRIVTHNVFYIILFYERFLSYYECFNFYIDIYIIIFEKINSELQG